MSPTTVNMAHRATSRATVARPTSTVLRVGDQGLRLRSLEHGEAGAVLAVFSGMGRRSRELRFLAAKPHLTDSDLRVLTAFDACHHVGVVVSIGRDERPIAIGRFIRDQHRTDSAEVALAVVDECQGRGIGTVLVRTLALRAVEVGVRRFTACISRENHSAHRLLAAFSGPVSLVRSDRWTIEYDLSLDEVPVLVATAG